MEVPPDAAMPIPGKEMTAVGNIDDTPPELEKQTSNLGTRRQGSMRTKTAEDGTVEEKIVVGPYARIVTKYPGLFMFGVLVFTVVWIGALRIPTNFSQGGAGGQARNSLKSKQSDALTLVRAVHMDGLSEENTIPKSLPPFVEENWVHTISFWFRSKSKNILSSENIVTQMNILERTVKVIGAPVSADVHKAEAELEPEKWTPEIRDNGFPTGFCMKLPNSVNGTFTEGATCADPDSIYHLTPMIITAMLNGSGGAAPFVIPEGSDVRDLVTEQNLKLAITLAKDQPQFQMMLNRYVSKDLMENFNNDGSIGAEWSTGKARTGGPLPGFKNQTDRDDDQMRIYQTQYMSTVGLPVAKSDGWIGKIDDIIKEELDKNKDIEVLYYGQWVWLSRLFQQLLLEVGFAVVAVVFVGLFMWLQLGSVFLTLTGMFEILISVVMALSTWKLFGYEGFTFYQALVVYIILGIGADDIFVFLDAWKQSRAAGKAVNESLETKFQWTFTRASNAMLVTSTTTIVAFLLSSITDIPDISTFAQFAALVVIWDLIYVLTWFPASVVIHHKLFVDTQRQCCNAGKTCGCCCLCCQEQWGLKEGDNGAASGNGELRWIEKFFNETLWNFLKGPTTKWIVIGIFGCLFIAGVVCAATTVKLTKKSIIDTIMVEGAELQEVLGLVTGNAGHFATGNVDIKSSGYLFMGIDHEDPVSRSGTDPYHGGSDPEDWTKQLGKINWDESLSLDTIAAQNFLKTACEKLRTSVPSVVHNNILNKKEVFCFIDDFEAYRTAKGLTFPVPDGQLAAALEDWRDDTTFLHPTAYKNEAFTGVTQQLDWPDLYSEKTNWIITDGKIKTMFIAGNNTEGTFVQDLDIIKPEYSEWEKVADELNADASGYKVMVVTDRTEWIAMMDALVKGITTGVPLSFFLAYVVLILATTNWIVASIAIVSIMGVLATFFITFAIAGWELDFYSTIFFQLTVGLAVDYIVHIAHAYNESGAESREDKMRDSLTQMGVSVLSGAISTLGASVFLFIATFLLFFQYGAFIFFVIMWSIIWALFFFPTVMMIIGPAGEQGDIVPLRNLLSKIGGGGGH